MVRYQKAPALKVKVNGTELEKVKKITYLGSSLDETWDHTLDIRTRLKKAQAYYQMQKILCNRQLNMSLRGRTLKCFVFSTLLYGVEAWTTTDTRRKQ